MTPSNLATFPWPLPEGAHSAFWTPNGFVVDGERRPVLAFGVSSSGWTDDLTTLHERAAGTEHPMDLASRERALRETLTHLPEGDAVVLEVGSSSGEMLRALRAGLPSRVGLIGSDYVLGPLRSLSASMPTTPILRFDLTRCPLPAASVDVVVALNVLEHIENDAKAVSELARILKPGGAAVIELPAGPWLYDVYDKALMHYRRYTMAGARSLFEGAGFRVRHSSHLGFFVYPAFAAIKLLNKRHLSKGDEEQKRIVASSIESTRASSFLRASMRAEHALRGVPLPFGVRCVLVAQRS